MPPPTRSGTQEEGGGRSSCPGGSSEAPGRSLLDVSRTGGPGYVLAGGAAWLAWDLAECRRGRPGLRAGSSGGVEWLRRAHPPVGG